MLRLLKGHVIKLYIAGGRYKVLHNIIGMPAAYILIFSVAKNLPALGLAR